MNGATITEPRRPALDRDTATRLAATEYDRFVAQLRALSPDDWHRPTACPGWDVHAVACHLLGMAEYAASPDEGQRQVRIAHERGGLLLDALTALQVEEHVHLSPEEVVERLAQTTPLAARGRRFAPQQVREMRHDSHADSRGEQPESWTIAYLLDVILTRDTWMHRSDIALATHRDMVLTEDHDAVLVADVAAEWALRHGQPCTLTLTGPAGGTWTFGVRSAERYDLDAVQFCRILSGRAPGKGLLATKVPF